MKLLFNFIVLVFLLVASYETKRLPPPRSGPARSVCRRKIVCTAIYQPICAAPVSVSGSLRTFSSACWLQNYNCKNPNSRYEMVYNQTCSPNIPITQSCQSKCNKSYKPLCSELLSGNGQIKQFSNICGLSDYNCRHRNALYQVAYNGTCSPNIPISPSCPKPCSKIYDPICAVPMKGSDDEMDFSNLCLLGNYNCQNRNKLYRNIYNGTCDDYYSQDYSSSSSVSGEDSSQSTSSNDNNNNSRQKNDNISLPQRDKSLPLRDRSLPSPRDQKQNDKRDDDSDDK